MTESDLLKDDDILAHAKAIKEYCSQQDALDEPCENCPFHFYRGYNGQCILNNGLYPNEWHFSNHLHEQND